MHYSCKMVQNKLLLAWSYNIQMFQDFSTWAFEFGDLFITSITAWAECRILAEEVIIARGLLPEDPLLENTTLKIRPPWSNSTHKNSRSS